MVEGRALVLAHPLDPARACRGLRGKKKSPRGQATIHKSQGSEYPAVVIPVLTQHYPMLQRNLLYTGVTRGKRLVVLLGQKKAVAIAVRNVSGRRRWSKLREWLLTKEQDQLHRYQ